jgi:uncharacterized protein YchJ
MRLSKAPKIPRNSSCPCGSGKKYKKCCLIKQEEQVAQQIEAIKMVGELSKESEK